jgi:methyltransferase-like protein/SAM-dependent methyltransferase
VNDLAEKTRQRAATRQTSSTAIEPAGDAPDATTAAASYDAVPYSVCAFAQTRPDRLAAIGALFGMDSAPPDRARVLELGCASGGNLIPMGLSWPRSQSVGLDLSQRQIQDGSQIVRELSLSNVLLHCQSILDVARDLGTFDYILCHGVYSWVPPQVQNKILEICRDHLNPQGIAYISYNTFPGWHARAAVREMLCYHTQQFDDPNHRIREARGLLTFLVRSTEGHEAGFHAMMRQELAVLAATPDTYLLHEHLEDFNEPLYFHQFIDRATEKGLQYLGEAQIRSMLSSSLGAEVEKTLRSISHDLVQMEQYLDFLRNRMFRQTLLCHEGVQLDYTLRPQAVQKAYLASSAMPVAAESDSAPNAGQQFRAAEKDALTLTTRDPLMRAAMTRLGQIWPESIAFSDLLAAAANGQPVSEEQSLQLAARLLRCYTSGVIELSLGPPRLVARVSERPTASPYARLRAREGSKVVNMKLESTMLDELGRLLLQNLDGQHDRAALVTLVQARLNEKSSVLYGSDAPSSAETRVDQILNSFARGALLIA